MLIFYSAPELEFHAVRDSLDAQDSLRGSVRAEELSETARAATAVMEGAITLANGEALDSLTLVPTAHLAPPPTPHSLAHEPQLKQLPTKPLRAKSRRETLEETFRKLGLSTGWIADLGRGGEMEPKKGGRWTFSGAEVRWVARERADYEKAMKFRRKLENDCRRLNGLPPKRCKKKRRPHDYDDDDEPL